MALPVIVFAIILFLAYYTRVVEFYYLRLFVVNNGKLRLVSKVVVLIIEVAGGILALFVNAEPYGF